MTYSITYKDDANDFFAKGMNINTDGTDLEDEIDVLIKFKMDNIGKVFISICCINHISKLITAQLENDRKVYDTDTSFHVMQNQF